MPHFLSRLLLASAIAALSFSASAEEPSIGRFEIVRFQVDGNTLIPTTQMDRLLAPFAGKDRQFSDVQGALETLEGAYHERGFDVVQVVLPEQELSQGVVHLKVVELRLDAIVVEGNRFFSSANIRNAMPGLRTGEIPNITSTSASLKLANENPAKKTTLQLRASAQENQIDAVLRVADEKPWRVALNLDNTGDDATGNTHVGVLYQNANINGFDHVLSLQYTTTAEHPSHVSVYGAGYHIPLYAYGDSVDLFATYSDVNAGTVSAGIFDLQVSGKGTVAGARYNQNIGRMGNYESKLVYGFDYKAFKSSVQLTGFSNFELGNDVTVHPLVVGHAGSWTLPRGALGYQVNVFHNLPGGANGGSADFARARSGASASYSVLRYGASYGRSLPLDWQLRATFTGQYTRDALVPGEQFGVAGSGAVRGFNEREVADDRGVMGSVETYTPNLCTGLALQGVQCRALAFYDSARVWRNKALAGEITSSSIASAGLGVRVSTGRSVSMQLDYGQVVDGSLTRDSGDDRLHLRVALSY